MEKIRLFTGIGLPEPVKEEILNLQNKLSCHLHNGIKWVKKENLHITLKFLGNVDKKKLSFIEKNLQKSFQDSEPIHLKINKLGAFPNKRYPKIIWVGTDEIPPHLNTLYKNIEEQLYQLAFRLRSELKLSRIKGLDFKKEKRKYHPHITIARVKRIKNKNILIDAVEKLEFNEKIIEICSFNLYQSTLTPKGAEYNIIRTYSIGDCSNSKNDIKNDKPLYRSS